MIAGIGLGLRRQFADELIALGPERAGVDFLEITPENWMHFGGRHQRRLAAAAERWPIVTHSVSLDVGGLSPLDPGFLRATAQTVRKLGAPFFSDHVCYSSAPGGRPLHDLLPLPFSEEAVRHTASRAREAAARVEAELVLENATFYSHMPGAEMDEAEFLGRVLAEGGCGMLLDVNNVYVNSKNHGFDPKAFLDRLPLDRVRQMHVAGHTLVNGTIIDTHIGPVIDPVWELYDYTLRRAGRMIPTILEWDQEIPALPVVLAETARAREVAKAAGVLR